MSGTRAPVRIGYIGSGYIARRHRNAMLSTGRIVPAAVADPNRAAAEYFAEIDGPTVYADHAALLEDARVDAVYICVPPAQRRAIERDVIARGLPFFVEKPLGVDLDGPTETAAEIAAAGLVHGVGYHWRHLDSLRTAVKRIADRPVHLAVAQWHDGLPGADWWRHLSRSGGQVVEQATHLIDACRLVLGDVTTMHALVTSGPTAAADALGGDVPSATAATLSFATGAVGTLCCSYAMPGRHRVQVEFICDGESLVVSEESLVITNAAGVTTTPVETDPYVRQGEAFLHALDHGSHPDLVSYADALETHRVAITLSTLITGGTE
jgi:predicted dehydrogenase